MDNFRMAAGFSESLRVSSAIHDIAQEQGAEEEDFGRQKRPHPHRGGPQLLGHVAELLSHLNGFVSHGPVPPPLRVNIGRASSSRWVFAQSYVWAEARESATPDPSLSRDWPAPLFRASMTRSDRSLAARNPLLEW